MKGKLFIGILFFSVALISQAGIKMVEVNYNPYDPTPSEISLGYDDNDYFEYIELLNDGASSVNLLGYQITNGCDFIFTTSYVLAAGARTLLVRSNLAFQARYGTGLPVAGEFTGKLKKSGETIELENGSGVVVHGFKYNDNDFGSWPSRANGGGASLELKDPNADPTLADSWRSSTEHGGSPGTAPIGKLPVVINEILTHTDDVEGDWIELYNTSSVPINVGGWLLSDEDAVRNKYVIPDGTMIGANGYLVFISSATFNNPSAPGVNQTFAFSELGEDAYLSLGKSGNYAGEIDDKSFGVAERDITFGRYILSDGSRDFVAMASITKNAQNSGPKVDSLVFSEIMYHPATGGVEFLEIHNISVLPQLLYDPSHPENRWKITGGIKYEFPAASFLAVGEYALIVPIDPEIFRTQYKIDPLLKIFGPITNSLANSGERISIEKPLDPEPDGFVPYAVVDSVKYNDKAPWPIEADGLGPSLERIDVTAYGNDPGNWRAANTEGSPGTIPQADADGDQLPDNWEVVYFDSTTVSSGGTGDNDGDGISDVTEYILGTSPTAFSSVPLEINIARTNNQQEIHYPVEVANGPGYYGKERKYHLEKTTSLLGSWSVVVGAEFVPEASGDSLFSVNTTSPTTFFRIGVSLE